MMKYGRNIAVQLSNKYIICLLKNKQLYKIPFSIPIPAI